MSQGEVSIFFANGLVTSITVLAMILLFWPLLEMGIRRLRGALRAGAA
jgi:uncharacterized membrane protein YhaH (DUF805 family)